MTTAPDFAALPRVRCRRWMYLTSRAPHQRWLLGIEQRHAQPAARLARRHGRLFFLIDHINELRHRLRTAADRFRE